MGDIQLTHSFRRTIGTELYEKTKDPLLVKKFLRHKSLTSTEVYMTFRGNGIQEALKEIGNSQDNQKDKDLEDFLKFYQAWLSRA